MSRDERGSILLIDDDPASRRPFATWLGDDGWSVFEAPVKGVAERVATFGPALVVWTGRAPDAFPDLGPPIVAVASRPLDDGGRSLVRRGAFDAVERPDGSDVEPLRIAVARAARHAAVRRDNERLATELKRANKVLQEQLVELQRQTRRQAMVEDALTLARDHALSASRAKSAFLTNMSHELRTPLNAMLGYAELMSETVDDTRVVADLGRIIFAGHHLLTLIDDVLDLAKIEGGHAALEVGHVDVDGLLETVRLQATPAAQQRGLRLSVERSEGLDGFRGDRRLVLQCLHQLVDNAIKFTEHGEVAVVASRFDDEVHFRVQDTGCGISPRDQAAILGAFHQVEAGGRRAGPGLGLAITSRLCDLMGGRLTVSSEVGVGSSFTLRVPCCGPDGCGQELPAWGDEPPLTTPSK
ncbi:MAG: ATP-binding protein [Myxococcota bacterium]